MPLYKLLQAVAANAAVEAPAAVIEADVVIIGSGIAGLCCGSLLAKYGYKVHVCESHYHAGGAAHAFEVKVSGYLPCNDNCSATVIFFHHMNYVSVVFLFHFATFHIAPGFNINVHAHWHKSCQSMPAAHR
jgi:phytoene dehydrogenase-like protein